MIPIRYLKIILLLFATFLLIDFFSFLYLKKSDLLIIHGPSDLIANKSELQKLKEIYDFDTGWDVTKVPRTSTINYKFPIIASYGDSFTYGTEVGDKFTWQEYLEANLHKEILNFGVAGYGIDQSYMKLKKNIDNSRAKIIIFAFIEDNFNRCLSIYRPFMALKGKVFSLTKPNFNLDKNNQLVLVENPIRSIDEIDLLSDPEFIRNLFDKDKLINFGQIPMLEFPYSYNLIRALYRSQDEEFRRQKIAGYFRAEKIARKVFDEVYSLATKKNKQVLFLKIPTYDEIYFNLRREEDRKWFDFLDQRFAEFCQARPAYNCLNLQDYLGAIKQKQPFFFTRRATNAHYSALGNKLIAEILLEKIKSDPKLNQFL